MFANVAEALMPILRLRRCAKVLASAPE